MFSGGNRHVLPTLRAPGMQPRLARSLTVRIGNRSQPDTSSDVAGITVSDEGDGGVQPEALGWRRELIARLLELHWGWAPRPNLLNFLYLPTLQVV